MSSSDIGLDPAELTFLFDAIQDYAIFLLGPAGEIRSWNSGAERTMGYRAPEVVGRNFNIFYGPDDQQKPQHELETAAREGRIEDEGWRVRKDGTRFWANTIITSLRDPKGKLTGFAKITRDLTQRRAAEERLRQSEEVFRLLVQSVKDYAIFLLDPTGHVATWNTGAQHIKGYAPSEIIGRHFSAFYTEEDVKAGKPARKLAIAQREGSVEEEGWRIRKDGSRFWANVIITAVFGEHGELRGFAKVTRDMTERRHAEDIRRELLEQREARLEAEEKRRDAERSYQVMQEANRAKDEFLMTLSHELRTPMTSILGWSRLLPSMPANDPTFKEAIAAIGRSAQLQARLIDDVLDVSRIVSGKLRLNVEECELVQILTASIETVRPSADAKSITIVASFAPKLGTLVVDPTRLQQVVWNLLSNAVKFTPSGGRIELRATRSKSSVRIEVIDSGEGIDPEFLPRVFDTFLQAESPSTRVHGGLGLGLSIVRYLVEAHGGTIAASSEGRGLGATFTVTLPIGASAGGRIATREPEQPTFSPARHTLFGVAVLVVDDDTDTRKVVRALLQHAGATVTDVASAEAALTQLVTFIPDVILTDLAMPRIDGYALARQIRDKSAAVKVIALSAFPPNKMSSKEGLFDAYITKPAEPSKLIDEVARVVGRSS